MQSNSFGIGIFSVKLCEQFTTRVSANSHTQQWRRQQHQQQPLCVVAVEWRLKHSNSSIYSTTNEFYSLDFSQQCATNESTSRTVSQSWLRFTAFIYRLCRLFLSNIFVCSVFGFVAFYFRFQNQIYSIVYKFICLHFAHLAVLFVCSECVFSLLSVCDEIYFWF